MFSISIVKYDIEWMFYMHIHATWPASFSCPKKQYMSPLRVDKTRYSGISGWYPCHQNMDDFPKIAGNLFANKSLLFLWIVLLSPLSSQKFPYLPVVRNFFSGEWWWFSLAIGPMDHARENGARETPRCWQRSCHSLVPKRLTLFNGKRMWNIGSGTKTEPWHFTPLQSGGNYIICDMYSVYITWFQ